MKIKNSFSAPLLCALVYLLMTLSGVFGTLLFSKDRNVYITIIAIQLFVLFLPALIYARLKGKGYAQKLRLRLFDADKLVFVLLVSLAMILGAMLINVGLTAAGHSLGRFSLYEMFATPGGVRGADTFYIIIAFALIPAIAEEFLFRSVIIAEYEPYGILSAVFMSALTFAMLHFSFAQIPVYLFCGSMLALLTYATRSVLAPIVAHFLYNMFGLFGQTYINTVIAQLQNYVLFVLILAGLFLLVLVLIFGEVERIYHNFSVQNKPSDYTKIKEGGKKSSLFFEAALSPAFLLCLLVYFIIAINI